MNKLTISLFLVALCASAALARTSPQIRRPFVFTPGQTYIYEYRGRQWNGIPQLADQYSGLILQCDVVLQAKESGKEIVMKLDQVKVEQLHTQSLDENDVRKLNRGQEQNEHQISVYKEELGKPIRFTYIDGKIVRFVAEAKDAEWSINIKKSILSLFQLDLAPQRIIKSPSQSNGYTSSEEIIRSSQSEMPLVYPIYEETFGGICETLYEIDSVDNVQGMNDDQLMAKQMGIDQDVLNVTKTVNYKNCLTDPSVSFERHAFDVNTQTFKGRLFSQEPTVEGYYAVPEELKLKYSSQKQHTGFAKDNVASPVPVERHSYTKYNITTQAPKLPLVNGRLVESFGGQWDQDMSMIEGIYSEGKIKYQADGDLLMSDTQQSLKLITCAPTKEIARLMPTLSGQLINIEPSQPQQNYETIQCELSKQRMRFYQAVSKFAQAQRSLNNSPSSALYSHKLVLPFALSASWYPLVATGSHGVNWQDSSVERVLEPEQLAKSYEHLLVSLADDVIAEDVAQSRKAGEKIVRLVNIVSFLPKYKLSDVYEHIVERLQEAKKQNLVGKQQQFNGKQLPIVVDNDEVAKWKVVRKLYLDSLPLAGSKQAIEMIEQLIESQRVKSWEAREMCEAVPANLRYPDTEIIDAFIRISQLPYVRQSRSLFASCSIAAGKMIGAAYSKTKDASYKPTTNEQKLPSQLEQADEIVQQVVAEADPRRQLPKEWQESSVHQELYERLILDEQDLIKYVKLYKQMLIKATTHHQKVVYIETLAHMRVPQVLPILEPFVSGRLSLAQCLGQQPLETGSRQSSSVAGESQWYNYNQEERLISSNKRQSRPIDLNSKDWSEEEAQSAEECNYMRTVAIYALAHVIRSNTNQVQTMLLPVFDNTLEPYQIRIAAFTTLMLAPLEDHILERIASQMWREPNKHVASFVVGTIDTMSKMNAPMMQPYKLAALKAAESMPKQYLDTWRYSWFAGGDHFNHMKQTGLAWVAEVIKSNVSSIPRAGYFHFGRYHGTAGSKFDNHIELGFTSKGLESLIKDYITYNKQNGIMQTNLVSSILENLYEAKSDFGAFYREARDSTIKSILMPQEIGSNSELLSKNFHFRRQQSIPDVNGSMRRPKRNVSFQARKQNLVEDEEAKLTIFSKIFDSTSYHALDRKSIVQLLEKSDDYLRLIMDELMAGGKLHYVKMMMPDNMWHMVPSQLGLPVIVTHRSPLIASIKVDGSSQLNLVNFNQKQQANELLNITALVHPKVMHSNFRFLFAVDQANSEGYGVLVEKSHQLSLPVDVSVAYKAEPRAVVSFAIEPKTPVRAIWTKESARTFVGEVALAAAQPDNTWLGQEETIRYAPSQLRAKASQLNRKQHEQVVPSILSTVESMIQEPKQRQNNIIEQLESPFKFERRFVQPLLNLELQLEGATDDLQVISSNARPDISLWWQMQTGTATEQLDQLDQHVKSGPFSELLHAIETGMNRQTKYLEFFSTIRPAQTSRHSPVYRFDFFLDQQPNTIVGQSLRIKNQTYGKQIGRQQVMQQQMKQQQLVDAY